MIGGGGRWRAFAIIGALALAAAACGDERTASKAAAPSAPIAAPAPTAPAPAPVAAPPVTPPPVPSPAPANAGATTAPGMIVPPDHRVPSAGPPRVRDRIDCAAEVDMECPPGFVDGCVGGMTDYMQCIAADRPGKVVCEAEIAFICPKGQHDGCGDDPPWGRYHVCIRD